jgi:hypothetical protein
MRAMALLGCGGGMRAIAARQSCPRQGRRRPTSRFCAAGANGAKIRQCWSARREATAIDENSSKVRRREDKLASVQIKPDIIILSRCKSTELFFSCCGSVAALALANCNEHVAEANITAPAHTQRSLHGAQIPRGKSGKITSFSRSG